VIEVDVPGFRAVRLEHLVLDYNGTLAVDGELVPGVAEAIAVLSPDLIVHVVTADTFGRAAEQLEGLPVRLSVLAPGEQDEAKVAYVRALGAHAVAAIGNGRNDRLMVREAALGIAVVMAEGAAVETLIAADVAVTDVVAALLLLSRPQRLVATLRR
jgi:soluble P-type ATPase